MSIHCGGIKIGASKAIEWAFFNHIRELKDGVTWFEFEINSDYYEGDHNPQSGIHLMILNWMIFEINYYSI